MLERMPITLAQAAPWDLPDPPPLPAPPLLTQFALEGPWLAVLLGIAGVAAWIAFKDRDRRRALTMAGSLLALGAVSMVVSRSVATPREVMEAGTLDLVRAVSRADAVLARALLTPDCRLYWNRDPDGLPLEPLLERVSTDFPPGGPFHLKDISSLRLDATLDTPDRGRVQIKLRATPEATGTPVFSWWRLDFRRDGGGWRVSGIQPISISGVGGRP